MTGPTPDPSGQIAPGLYHAEGDPPGTVRQWDGRQWVGDPIPAPPGGGGGMAPRPGFDPERYGTLGYRILAVVIDVVITVLVAVAIAIPLVAADVIDETADATAGGSFGIGAILAALVSIAIQMAFIAMAGGTPGKLLVGLRITEADGSTTPPSWEHAARRVVPIAILTNLPLIGWISAIIIVIFCIIWISNDPERRSPYDRIGDTRVVFKNRL